MKAKKISPFRTPAQDARIAQSVMRGARPASDDGRQELLDALFGDRAATGAAAQLLDAYRAYSAQLRHRTRDRSGRPAEDLRDWLVGRARRIFRAAWGRRRDLGSPTRPERMRRGAVLLLGDHDGDEGRFVVLVLRLAQAPAPADVRVLFDTPGGSIVNAASGPAGGTPERQRVVDRIVKKVSQARAGQVAGRRPKIGPNSGLAAEIRKLSDAGNSASRIARELGCSRNTVRRYYKP